MDERVGRIAALANTAVYNDEYSRGYVDGAPHIKHASLRSLYGELVAEVYDAASRSGRVPEVLDLGAGEGSVTIPFLELGARVTAVDLSESQLSGLRSKCSGFEDRLQVKCQDVLEVLKNAPHGYDIIVANSFLHHVPDYLGLVRAAVVRLSPSGQFFSFQDPVRADSIGRAGRLYCSAAYCSWRLFKGDLLGGVLRRLRRSRGVYLEDCPEDNAEYHAVRSGVDQDAIAQLLRESGLQCRVIRYFSTQSRLFQSLGTLIGITNTFAVVASRAEPEGISTDAALVGRGNVED